jgi:hypothetical protein
MIKLFKGTLFDSSKGIEMVLLSENETTRRTLYRTKFGRFFILTLENETPVNLDPVEPETAYQLMVDNKEQFSEHEFKKHLALSNLVKYQPKEKKPLQLPYNARLIRQIQNESLFISGGDLFYLSRNEKFEVLNNSQVLSWFEKHQSHFEQSELKKLLNSLLPTTYKIA